MADKKTIETYNAKAADYVALVSRTTPDVDLQAFIENIPKGGLVLDLGCGPGNSAAMMQDAGLLVEATDASEKMVEIARTKYGLSAELATFSDLDAVARYDGIWANFSLLHAPKSDMPKHLSAIHKALKPKGHFHIGLKLGTGEQRDTINRMYTYYEEDELKGLMIETGFKITGARLGEGEGLAGDIAPFVIVTANA